MEDAGNPWRPEAFPPSAAAAAANGARPPEIPWDPMEFLSRSWSVSALEVSKALAPAPPRELGGGGFLLGGGGAIPEEGISTEQELEMSMAAAASNTPFTFAAASTSQLILERIMSHSEVSQLTSGRLSHSSGPLNGGGGGGSLTDSPPVSPSNADDIKYCAAAVASTAKPQYYKGGGSKTVGRWLKDRRERKKEETRAQNAQLHAAVSVAGVAAAIAAVAAATAAAASQGKDDQAAKTDMAVASAATLVAAHCVEAAEAMGAEREHLAAVVGSAVNVRTPGDIVTLTAAAATALRGAATLKARALKEVWNVAAVVPVEKGGVADHPHHYRRHHQQQEEPPEADEKDLCSSGELPPEDNFLGLCSQELLARGTELLKRTRKGSLHWKVISVYINKTGQVMLKMKSRYAAGTITKKKKSVVADVCKDIPAWPGRHLLEGGEQRRYFGLKTDRRVIEFECRSQRDYEIWTQGVARLLDIAAVKRCAA